MEIWKFFSTDNNLVRHELVDKTETDSWYNDAPISA